MPEAEFRTRLDAVYQELKRRLAEQPGVTGITFADRLPGMQPRIRQVQVEASEGSTPDPVIPQVWVSSVDLDFFEAFRSPVLFGRGFDGGDLGEESRAVIVNEAFSRQHFAGGSPLGRRVRYVGSADEKPGPWYEIVGMVKDLGMDPTGRGEAAFLFHPASPAAAYPPSVAVRVQGDPLAIAPRLRDLAARMDPGLRLYEVLPLEKVVLRTESMQITATVLLVGLLCLGLLLSAAGIFSLMAVSVARRTREIAVRVALGASRRRLLGAIFSRAAAQVGAGLIVGNLPLAGVVATSPDLGVSELLGGFAVTSSILFAVGLLACIVPARRALRIAPTEALKDA